MFGLPTASQIASASAASVSATTRRSEHYVALLSGAGPGYFAGSDRGGERAAAMYTLIATAKLNDINPQAWLADVLARIADHPASRLHELLPWNWKARPATLAA